MQTKRQNKMNNQDSMNKLAILSSKPKFDTDWSFLYGESTETKEHREKAEGLLFLTNIIVNENAHYYGKQSIINSKKTVSSLSNTELLDNRDNLGNDMYIGCASAAEMDRTMALLEQYELGYDMAVTIKNNA